MIRLVLALVLSWTTPSHVRQSASCSDSTATTVPDSVRVCWWQQSPTYLAHEAAIRAANPDTLRAYWPAVRSEAAYRVYAVLKATVGTMSCTVPDSTGRTWFVQAHNGAGWEPCVGKEVAR